MERIRANADAPREGPNSRGPLMLPTCDGPHGGSHRLETMLTSCVAQEIESVPGPEDELARLMEQLQAQPLLRDRLVREGARAFTSRP